MQCYAHLASLHVLYWDLGILRLSQLMMQELALQFCCKLKDFQFQKASYREPLVHLAVSPQNIVYAHPLCI